MNNYLEQILSRPRPQKIGILAGAMVLLLALGFFYVYQPTADQMTRLTEEAEKIRQETIAKKIIVANLPKLQRDLQEWDVKLKTVVAQLPNSREIPDLLSNISTKAREAGLEIILFRPRAENLKEFYAEIPVDIVVRGGFNSAVNFFDEIGKFNRLVNIDNIDFKNPKVQGDQVGLEISTLATTYRFMDEAERKQVAEQKAKAAKK
ncbi:MAG: type 4a pilus biogenesis protein PilO [Deltaproteobacteria bacterium]|nr:type 4a pilus biogenesis protein PilO [Deltaproteobacteria bacterium]